MMHAICVVLLVGLLLLPLLSCAKMAGVERKVDEADKKADK